MLPHMTVGTNRLEHELDRCDLPVAGMTCASCAARIESSLGQLPGVDTAAVNFATNRATVTYDPAVTGPASFSAAVADLGYSVPDVEPDDPEAEELRDLTPRLVVAVVLGIPVLAISMVPGAAVLGLAVGRLRALHPGHPVVGLAVPPRHPREPAPRRHDHGHARLARHHRGVPVVGRRAGVPRGRRHRESGGCRAACRWARCSAARATARTSTSRPPARSSRCCSSGSTSRPAPAAGRARRLRALLELGAKTARLENGDEIPVASLRVGDRFVVRPGEKIATDGIVVEGASAVDVSMLTGRAGAGRRRDRATRCSAPPSTPAADSWSRPPGSAARPRWRRSRGWWRRRRGRRRRCNGWPTASRRSSSPSCS